LNIRTNFKEVLKRLLLKIIQIIKKPTGLLSDNYKRKYNTILELFAISGLDKNGTSCINTNLKRIASLADPKEKLTAVRELVRYYPDHPLSHLELVHCLHAMSDPYMLEQMNCYWEVRNEWLKSTGYGELGLEFIHPGNVVGSLGNHFTIESLLKANQVGLRTASKPVLLLSQNDRFRNPALFSYFQQHLCVIRNQESVNSMRKLETLLTLPLGLCLPMNEGCYYLDLAANRAEMEREKQGLDQPLFHINERHQEMGRHALKKLGLSKDAWYVTLHVREPGYRGETRENTTENWRNANPLDYIKACKAVTSAGGWVFRMGDPSMTPLPPIPQVVDYAHHEIRSDWMDVFLGATCRFLIGTGSGYFHIPAFFGRPCMMTNFPGFAGYYGMRNQDLFLPRWLRNIKTEETVSFEQYMSPPISFAWKRNHFSKRELHWVENSPEELEAATKEMLERTDGGFPSTIPDDDLQQRFKILAEVCGKKYHGRPVKAFASISRDFINRNADLLP